MSLILSGTDGLSDVDGSAATPAIRGTDANTGIFFGTDIIGFSEGGVEAMRINASGNLQTIGTISVGNATPSTSGAGITFPATQPASSNANTLDDYEEGPFTPTGNGVTFAAASGSYTKVGRAVTFRLDATWPTTSNTSNARIAGLPFASATGTAFAVWTDRGAAVSALSSASSTFLYDLSGVELTNTNMSAKSVSLSGVYFV
jgi:hypothetical protein